MLLFYKVSVILTGIVALVFFYLIFRSGRKVGRIRVKHRLSASSFVYFKRQHERMVKRCAGLLVIALCFIESGRLWLPPHTRPAISVVHIDVFEVPFFLLFALSFYANGERMPRIHQKLTKICLVWGVIGDILGMYTASQIHPI